MATEHTVHLSEIDQSVPRVYIRLAFCYYRGDTNLRTVAERIDARVKCTITHFPVLAGVIRAATNTTTTQQGRLEVITSLDRVKNFKAITTSVIGLPGIKTYNEHAFAGMPTRHLINGALTPLPDTPAADQQPPVFAIRINVIPEGLIVALYLHHAVGDLIALRFIIDDLSSDRPPRELNEEVLAGDALQQSTQRSQLSSSNGRRSEYAILSRFVRTFNTITTQMVQQVNFYAPCNVACLFSFDIARIEDLKTMVATRNTNITSELSTPATSFAILSAILWKAITAARMLRGVCIFRDRSVLTHLKIPLIKSQVVQADANEAKRQTSTLSTAVDFRQRIDAIEQDYFGNAVLQVFASQPIEKLALPISIPSIEEAARSIMEATGTIFDGKVRSTIAAINEASDVSKVAMNGMRLSSDLAILDWASINLEEANLGLGLGAPGFGRQISSGVDTFTGCIVHTKREEAASWDVTVQLSLPTMQRLRADVGFMNFVRFYA